jgi:hypothetical protein
MVVPAYLLAADASSTAWVRGFLVAGLVAAVPAACRTDADYGPTGVTPVLYALAGNPTVAMAPVMVTETTPEPIWQVAFPAASRLVNATPGSMPTMTGEPLTVPAITGSSSRSPVSKTRFSATSQRRFPCSRSSVTVPEAVSD